MKSTLNRLNNLVNWTLTRTMRLSIMSIAEYIMSGLNQKYTIFTVSNFPEPYWDVFNSKQLFFFTRTLRK